ncbi:glycosyl hydrolase family 5 [Leptospira wolffii]|uniref:glycoside hydrolase family 5 protein n=1 Tax=Leptospira wolffii TaxID=409998 RepID=UPI00108269AA|nr:cellulase family glycosylhydrolase [Leptospira wolffii]TGK55961.1 glycosyl hydrolase family 5 [Leptospira wolffii]TGK68381.1 glycosyl hydrolase family 5 [Leptospira wolffii]TGK72007.1 glycosyl hydrolase family 5 [Leptospira wolffii]TGL27584.1 glycosyl hydrolase family 5 [Leptospira wolffii]
MFIGNRMKIFCFVLAAFVLTASCSRDSQAGFFPFSFANSAKSTAYSVMSLAGMTVPPAVPLSTSGRYIVDSSNNRFKLKAVNWYGASDTKQVVGGLDKQPISHIISLIQEWGFNSVRLPFSNKMLHDTNAVPNEYVAANPQFFGKTPLEIYDLTVEALTSAGIVVVLNNHTTFSEWCCGFDYNGQWYHTGSSFAYNQTPEMWKADWVFLADRYKNNKLVAAADLRNEVRTMRFNDTFLPNSPNWGWGNIDDWRKAAQEAGNDILRVNPDILIVVEGINWWGAIPILGSGERPHLKPVRDLQVHIRNPNKLLYAAHNYGYIGPKHNGDDGTSGGNIKYKDMDATTFRNTITDEWGYVTDPDAVTTAPVWVSEFGASPGETNPADREWFKRLVDYLIEKDIDFAFWPLNGEDEWGLVTSDWSQTKRGNWRDEHLDRLISYQGKTGSVSSVDHLTKLSFNGVDDNASTIDNDWLSGANKGTCPDGERLLGLSRDQRAFCSDTKYGKLWHSDRGTNVQAVYETSTRYHGTGDWAGGFTKYECPNDYYVAGATKHSWGTSGVLCARSKIPLANSCRTIWFDRGDNRSSQRGGDWASGSYKGQCADTEYVAGIAQRDGGAAALLCCSSPLSGELPLVYKAKNLSHRIGFAEGDAWVATTADFSADHILYGPYDRGRWGTGNKQAIFRILVDVTNANNDKVLTLDVFDGQDVLARRDVYRNEFIGPGQYTNFILDFNIAPDKADRPMEIRAWWHDTSYVKVDNVTVQNRNALGDLPLTYKAKDLGHRTGFAEGDAWVVTTADNWADHILFGPYDRGRWGSGNKKAVFRMLVDVTNANNDKVVTLDVFDGQNVLASRDVYRQDFSGPGQFTNLDLDFSISPDRADRPMEVRAWWYDTSYVKTENVTVQNR